MSMDKFLATIKDVGVAESSKFVVEITIPEKLYAFVSDADTTDVHDVLTLYCNGATLPETEVMVDKRYTFGMPKPIGSRRKDQDQLMLSFYADRDMQIKKFWDSWLNLIYQNEDVLDKNTLLYPDDYTGTVTITQLDRMNNPTYQVTLYDAFPSNIINTQLSSSNTKIIELQINLSYHYWRRTEPTGIPTVDEVKNRGILGMLHDGIESSLKSVDQFVNQAKSVLSNFTSFHF